MRRKLLRYLIYIIIILFIAIKLELSGYLYHNDFFAYKYEIHGIDVSHHQKRINWNKVDKNKYKFVIIKATEGKNFLDRNFYYNWHKIKSLGFTIGAYHFFSMYSSGEEQAKFYISKVPKGNDTLPPIVDLEIPTKYDKKVVLKQLKDMIDLLEQYYKKRVIIYVTQHTYNYYIKGEFLKNNLWVRNIKFIPLSYDNRWVIWQYSNRGLINGIPGFVDKNVFKFNNLQEYIKKSRIEEEK